MVGDMDPIEAQKIRQKMLEREIEEQSNFIKFQKDFQKTQNETTQPCQFYNFQ